MVDYMRFLMFVLGLTVGSFLNVVIDRIPKGESVIWNASHCDHCKKRLRWFELFPVFSFILQRGRCTRCRKRLSLQYPLVELLTAVGFVYLYPDFLAILIFSCLLVLFAVDMKRMILPDAALVVLGIAILVGSFAISPSERLTHACAGIGAGLGFLSLWLVTRRQGFGFGDVKLVTLLGLFLGYPLIIIALYIAFLTGAIVGVILMMSHRAKLKSRIAFGPFLIIGAVSASLWGENMLRWWRTLI